MRLATIYALLDQSTVITVAHLQAALACWRYAEASAQYKFGEAMGDQVADTTLKSLRQMGEMTRTDVRDLFGRNQSVSRIDHALTLLLNAGKIRREMPPGKTRNVECWIAV